MVHRLRLLSVLFFLTFQTFGQIISVDTLITETQNLTTANVLTNTYAPKVIPPSPEAASLGRYGEIPVELSKGTPSINIPVYEVISGSLKLPISFSYHASGVRVNDVATSVGLSWTLNAGGAITRAVNGKPDESVGGFNSMNPPSELDDAALMCYIGQIAAGDGVQTDGSPDTYFYNFNGQSGKFMYANKRRTVDANLAGYVPVTIPYKPMKIEGSYKITDVDGTIYLFGQSVGGQSSIEVNIPNSDNPSYTSAWYLSSIISANRMDTISIRYTSAFVSTFDSYTTSLTRKTWGFNQVSMDYKKSKTSGYNTTVYPEIIYFKNGRVNFIYATDRQDLPLAKRLASIYIYKKNADGSYAELKHYDLNQSYFNCTDGATQFDPNIGTLTTDHSTTNSHLLKRLRLDKITEKTSSNKATPPHEFTYYLDHNLPIYGSYAQDYWGFYNGKTSNDNLLVYDTDASRTATPAKTYGANREPDFAYILSGTLKDIIYPTGGKTTFEFEPHRMPGAGSTIVEGGGIRVKSITNSEGSVQLTKKQFVYTSPYILSNIYPGNMDGLEYPFTLTAEEDNGNCGHDIVTYTTFQENYSYMLGTNSGSSMAYEKIEEKQVDVNNNPLGKTESTFTQYTDGTPSTFPFLTNSNEWRRGHILEEKTFNSAGNIVKHVKNVYKEVLTDTLVKGFGARILYKPWVGSYSGGSGTCSGVIHDFWCTYAEENSTVAHRWAFHAIKHAVGAIFLDSTTTVTYSETGASGLTEIEAYTYGSGTHHLLTKKVRTNSKNQPEETIYKYPHEMAASNADYQEMVNRHIFTPVIEEENKLNGTSINLIKTTYKKWYPSNNYGGVLGFFAPLSVQTQQAGGPLITQIIFGEKLINPVENGYDNKAHPIVYTDPNATVTRLKWWQERGKLDLVNVKTVTGSFSTTYDYIPLTGIESITDLNGKVTFYQYDNFARLITIREDNKDGAIRKSFCYNYAGQPISCDVITGVSGAVTPSTLNLLADASSAPPPVLDFAAAKEEQTAVLTWKTVDDTETSSFDVERSTDGRQWFRIGQVDAKVENRSAQDYLLKDLATLGGRNFYRLKMASHDGSEAYSSVQEVEFENDITLYPNPLVTSSKLLLKGTGVSKITNINIYDQNGKLIYTGKPQGNQIDISAMPTGSYLIQFTSTNGVVTTQRFVKK